MGSEKSIARFTEEILAFLTEDTKQTLRANKERERVLGEESERAMAEGYALSLKLRELRERLGGIQRGISERRRSFEEDFEELLRQEGVKKIYAEDGILYVETKRVFQVYAGKQYDIGQRTIIFDFTIYPSSREHIGFRQGPYLGTHQHPHAHATNTCFGSHNATGLNNPVSKLMGDFNLVALIPLILSFLRFDDQMPPLRADSETANTPPYDETTDRTGYASEKERGMAKDSFIDLCRQVSERNSTSMISKEIAELAEREKKEDAAFTAARTGIQEAALVSEEIEKGESCLPEKAAEEAQKLLAHTDVKTLWHEGLKLKIRFAICGQTMTMEFGGSHPPKISGYSAAVGTGRSFSNTGMLRVDDHHRREHVVRLQHANELCELFEYVQSIIAKDAHTLPFKGESYDC